MFYDLLEGFGRGIQSKDRAFHEDSIGESKEAFVRNYCAKETFMRSRCLRLKFFFR